VGRKEKQAVICNGKMVLYWGVRRTCPPEGIKTSTGCLEENRPTRWCRKNTFLLGGRRVGFFSNANLKDPYQRKKGLCLVLGKKGIILGIKPHYLPKLKRVSDEEAVDNPLVWRSTTPIRKRLDHFGMKRCL